MTGIEMLLRAIDQAFDCKAWHGTNLRGSIRGLEIAVAAFRPSPQRRNIWEIVVHAAYWKYVVRRRILGEKRGSFPLKGSNWFTRPVEFTDAAWRKDIELLEAMHQTMREGVAVLKDRDLGVKAPGSKASNADMLFGIAAHDVYHAGQIQCLKKLAESAKAEP